jgi:hypothetical protein
MLRLGGYTPPSGKHTGIVCRLGYFQGPSDPTKPKRYWIYQKRRYSYKSTAGGARPTHKARATLLVSVNDGIDVKRGWDCAPRLTLPTTMQHTNWCLIMFVHPLQLLQVDDKILSLWITEQTVDTSCLPEEVPSRPTSISEASLEVPHRMCGSPTMSTSFK